MIKSKKGQAALGLGVLIAVAITVIVGAILMQVSAQNVGEVTNTYEVANTSFAAVNNTLYTFTGYRALADVVIWNNTADTVILVGNYTVTNNVITDGALTTTVAVNFSSAVYAGDGWNISGTAQPTTYATNGGSRAMANLVIIFFALAVAMVTLYPVLKSNILGN